MCDSEPSVFRPGSFSCLFLLFGKIDSEFACVRGGPDKSPIPEDIESLGALFQFYGMHTSTRQLLMGKHYFSIFVSWKVSIY